MRNRKMHEFLTQNRVKYGKTGASNFMQEVIDFILAGDTTVEELMHIAEEQYQYNKARDRFVAWSYWAAMRNGILMLYTFAPREGE